jgi:hypothetical protein
MGVSERDEMKKYFEYYRGEEIINIVPGRVTTIKG